MSTAINRVSFVTHFLTLLSCEYCLRAIDVYMLSPLLSPFVVIDILFLLQNFHLRKYKHTLVLLAYFYRACP